MNFYYFDANGQKHGPINAQQLQELVDRGIITPNMPLETDSGEKGFAGQISTLKFNVVNPIQTTQTPSFWNIIDVGFTRFFTNIWISMIWVSNVILAVVLYIIILIVVIIVVAYWHNNVAAALFGIVVSLLATFAMLSYLMAVRMVLETTTILFRIESNTRELKDRFREK